MQFKDLIKLTCAFGALATAAPAIAQETSGGIGDIVVTANKRAENVQDIPATVTAVSADTLVSRGIRDIQDITKAAPEFQVVTGGAFSNVAIRGTRTGTFGPSADSPNAVHIDGVYLSRFTGLQGLLYDLERVEVLAGPQGTLYGRNSAGGAVNIITRNPTQEFGGSASVDVGNYDSYTVNAAINLPITDKFAVRAAYYSNSHDPYQSDGSGDADQESFRVKGRWTPTESDTILVSVDHQINKSGQPMGAVITSVLKQPTIQTTSAGVISVVDPTTATPAGATRVVVPVVAVSDPYDRAAEFGPVGNTDNRSEASGGMIQYDHDFGWANLTAQVAYRDTMTYNTRLGSAVGFPQDLRLMAAGVIRPQDTANIPVLESHGQWDSEEIRLTSPSDQQLTWVVGAYRFHEKLYDNHCGSYGPVTFGNTTATAGQITVGPINFSNLFSDTDNSRNIDDAWAVFGQGTYTIAERLHLTLGIRYNEEEKEATGYIRTNGTLVGRTVFPRLACPAGGPACPVTTAVTGITGTVPAGTAGETGLREFSRTTYKANVAYDITPSNMIYADYSTGFKAGGFVYGSVPYYPPETVTSIEIGTKNQFFDRRVQVNFSAWHVEDEQFSSTVQEVYFDPFLLATNPASNGVGQHLSAGTASSEIDGQSLQATWLVTENDTLAVNAIHNDARFTNFNAVAANAVGLNTLQASGPFAGLPVAHPRTAAWFDYAGTPVGNVMEWSGSATYNHVFRIFGGELDGQIAAQYYGKRLQGNQVAVLDTNAYFLTDPWTSWDTLWRYQKDDANWSLSFYVRNITEEEGNLTGLTTNLQGNPFPVASNTVTYAYGTLTPQNPRTFGVIFNADF